MQTEMREKERRSHPYRHHSKISTFSILVIILPSFFRLKILSIYAQKIGFVLWVLPNTMS